MVLNKKTIGALLGTAFLGCVIGSVGWEIVERIVNLSGTSFSLSLAEPISFDLHVIALSFRPNLGSLLGFVGGVILFFLL